MSVFIYIEVRVPIQQNTFDTHPSGSLVGSLRIEDITNANPAKLHNLPLNSSIKYYPSAAGNATLYKSNTNRILSDLDDDATKITNSTNGRWDAAAAGSVSAVTTETLAGPLQSIALVPTDGTWVLEVTVQ